MYRHYFPMFDTVCTLPLSSDLFAQAIHPNEPLLAVGLSSGHVATLKLPPVDEEPEREREVGGRKRRGSNGTGVIDTAWRTKRHQGSCRSLGYSIDGRNLYSAGTDGILKAADTETGKVTGKVVVPFDTAGRGDKIDAPTVVHALSPQTLLLATDSGALHLYDLRDPAPSIGSKEDAKTAFINAKPAQTHHPHTDYISSLTALPPSSTSTSGYSKQFLTTGGTTLALTDLRRGVLVKSEDQEDILLSSLYVTGLAAKKSSGSTGEKAIVGGGDGVVTLWEKGQWDDQDERIIISREIETLDVMAQVPEGIGGVGKKIAIGLGDGMVRFVLLGQNKVVGEVQHHEFEGVAELDFDVGGRMISGGGQSIKVWHEATEPEAEDDEDDNEIAVMSTKRAATGSDDDSDEDEEEEDGSSEEEVKERKKRKKRKRGKGPASTGPGFNFSGLD